MSVRWSTRGPCSSGSDGFLVSEKRAVGMLDVEKLGEPCRPLGDKRGFRHDDKRGQLQMRDDESSDDRFPEPGWGREDSVVVLEQLVGSMLLLGTKDAAELGRNVSACVSLVAIGVADADFIEQLKQALLASSWKGDMPLDVRQEKPLIGVGVELFVNGDAIAFALSFPLEWQGYQVAESAFRNSCLSWEHAVVGIELDRFGAPHCLGDEGASEVAGKLRAYGPLEEEPDMATVSRS